MRSRRGATALLAFVCLVAASVGMTASADATPTLTITASPEVVKTWQGEDTEGNTSTLTVTALDADGNPAADETKISLEITKPSSSGASFELAVGPDVGIDEVNIVVPNEAAIDGRQVNVPSQEIDLEEDGIPASVTVPGAHICCTPGVTVPLPGASVTVGPAGVSVDDHTVATPTPYGPSLSSNEVTLTNGSGTATYAGGPSQAQDEIVATWSFENGGSVSASVTVRTCVDPSDPATCDVNQPLPPFPCNPSIAVTCLPEELQKPVIETFETVDCVVHEAEADDGDPTTCQLPAQAQAIVDEAMAVIACAEEAEDPFSCLPQ